MPQGFDHGWFVQPTLFANLGAPFGGYKASGIGRELGPEGTTASTEYKTISVPA